MPTACRHVAVRDAAPKQLLGDFRNDGVSVRAVDIEQLLYDEASGARGRVKICGQFSPF